MNFKKQVILTSHVGKGCTFFGLIPKIKVPHAPPSPNFLGPKNSMKIHEFFISNSPYYKKKLSKKEFFQNHPYVIRKWFFGFLKKTNFLDFFLFKFTLFLKTFFYVFFLKIFGKLKYLTPPHSQTFLTFFGFGEKRVFNRERTFFFVFQKKK